MGAGAGAAEAGVATATVGATSWASAGIPAIATSADSNTISRIWFFNSVLLFGQRGFGRFTYFCGLKGEPAPVTNSGARPLGPRVVRLREAHALIKRRIV